MKELIVTLFAIVMWLAILEYYYEVIFKNNWEHAFRNSVLTFLLGLALLAFIVIVVKVAF